VEIRRKLRLAGPWWAFGLPATGKQRAEQNARQGDSVASRDSSVVSPLMGASVSVGAAQRHKGAVLTITNASEPSSSSIKTATPTADALRISLRRAFSVGRATDVAEKREGTPSAESSKADLEHRGGSRKRRLYLGRARMLETAAANRCRLPQPKERQDR
jgi:hypothetical protein